MELDKIRYSLNEAKVLLDKFISDKKNIENIGKAADLIISSIKSGGKVISFGNGGSMSDAMHFAEEMTGLFRDERRALPAIAVSDPSHISCTANDYGFDSIFSRYVEALGKKGDVVLAISTSGNSGNVIKAAEKAREIGIGVISLTGKTGGRLAALSDVEIRVPHDGYSDRIQEIHIKVIHILIELIEKGVPIS